jgi:hypothetical protein
VELAAVELARPSGSRELLELGETQTAIGHDVVEVLHQLCLRQRRQLGERCVGAVGSERLAVVRRVCDGVLDQPAKPLAL